MKKFKCLMSIVLSLGLVLTGVSNSFAAWWNPDRSEVKKFLKDENISFINIPNDDVASLIMTTRGHSDLSDFILGDIDSFNETKKKELCVAMIRFIREKFKCSDISDDEIIARMTSAANIFKSPRAIATRVGIVAEGKDVTGLKKKFVSDERLFAEADIKRLIVYLVVLDKWELRGDNEKIAIKAVDGLLKGVFTEIQISDKKEKEKKAQADKIRDIDGKVVAMGSDIVALKGTEASHEQVLRQHEDALAEIQKRLNDFERRMTIFEELNIESFKKLSDMTAVIYNKLKAEGRVDDEDYKRLVGALDRLSAEFAKNSDHEERLVELSKKVHNIGKFSKILSRRVDAHDEKFTIVECEFHDQSEQMSEQEQQIGDALSTLLQLQTDVKMVTDDYHTHVVSWIKGYFGEREKELRDAYNKAGSWTRSRMRDAYPYIDFEKKEK